MLYDEDVETELSSLNSAFVCVRRRWRCCDVTRAGAIASPWTSATTSSVSYRVVVATLISPWRRPGRRVFAELPFQGYSGLPSMLSWQAGSRPLSAVRQRTVGGPGVRHEVPGGDRQGTVRHRHRSCRARTVVVVLRRCPDNRTAAASAQPALCRRGDATAVPRSRHATFTRSTAAVVLACLYAGRVRTLKRCLDLRGDVGSIAYRC
jgi:hypothetical protein